MPQEILFGRKFYLDILEKRIKALKNGYRQNIAIIGDELVGKTSIIFDFLNNFYDNHIIPFYLEIRPETIDSFAKRFIGVLLYNFLINSGVPLTEDIDFLNAKASRYIPKTSEKIKSILALLNRRKKNNVLTELLSLCELINLETGKCCVVIWDEFHNLASFDIKSLYSEFSKILITQKTTMYIILSSHKFKAKTILSKNLSLLFGNFETILVEPFDIKTSQDYLDHRLAATKTERGLKDFITYFTGGYPFYLKLISDSIMKSNGAALSDILEELLFSPTGILNQRFSNYLKRFLDTNYSQDYVSILYWISNGHNKLKDIAHILRKTAKELNARLTYLLEADAVTRNGDFLKINDRVFSFWLKFVYQERLSALTFDAKNQKAAFREKIEGLIQEFFTQARRPITERITEVLHLFTDEMIQIENKRLRLNHFREIKPLEFNNMLIKEGLIGRSSDSLWIMALKDGFLTEEDIIQFSKECKKYRHKSQKKIIIALKDMDANAHLRALEEKIWTWNLNSLNQILDTFFKPRIIV